MTRFAFAGAAMLAVAAAAGASTSPPFAGTPPKPAPETPPTLELAAPISRWDEGLPLGNGLFGVLAWGEGNVLRFSLDRGDLWDTRVPETLKRPDWTYATMLRLKEAGDHAQHIKLFDEPYDTIAYPTKLPLGRLEITLGDLHAESFRLRLGERSATVWLAKPGMAKPCTLRVDRRRAVAVVSGLPAEAGIRLIWPEGFKKLDYPPPETGGEGGWAWWLQQTSEGKRFAVAARLEVSPPPHKGQPYVRSVAVAVVTGDEAADPLAEAKARAARAVDVYRAPPEPGPAWDQEWKEGFAASWVTLPDARVQALYDLGKHLYIAGSRVGAPPLALQGVWTADEGGLPPWKGDYHNDLNTQMTYSAYGAAGLLEQGRAWLEFNWALRPAYQRFAREFYGVDGLVAPGVMTIDGRPMGGWGQYSLSPTHTAWIGLNFVEHWRLTRDRVFLKERCYPWCAEAGRALIEICRRDERGKLMLPLSSSPEIFDNSFRAWLPPNSNYDLSLMRFLFGACAEMAGELGLAEEQAAWREALASLDELDTDPASGALTFAKGLPYHESHRHFSHAMAIYPLGTLTVEGSERDRATISATLDELEARGTSQWCGYSFAWMSAMAARCGQAERARSYLEKTLAFTGRNGFHLNGDQTKSGLSNFTYRPFTLEGNFMAMQAVHEMLVQGWGGVVRVFPAVSDRWAEVRFRDLRAEGGWLVSAERRDGKTQRVRVTSAAAGGGGGGGGGGDRRGDGSGRELRLRDPFAAAADGPIAVRWSGAEVRRDGRDWVARLGAGEWVEGVRE